MADDIPPDALKNLSKDDYMDIEAMAAGMSESEVLDYFDLTIDKLNADEKIYFSKYFKKGRGAAKRQMVEALMKAAKGKGGGAFAALYLSKQAEEWPNGKDDTSTKSGFSFKVIAVEGEKKTNG